MKHLLPADVKALALSAWLFYSERGFATDLIHIKDSEEIILRVTFEDTKELPMCQQIMHPSFQTSVVRVGYSDKVYTVIFPTAFI
jgi:hypothetical protein